MEKKIVLVACGTGIATSTVVNDAVTKLAKLNNIPVEIIQCKMMEVPSYADRANLLITTTVADKSKYNFPVINARAFLTGIGLDKTKEEILAAARSFENVALDVVEWRVDWFEGVFDFEKVEDVLKELRAVLGETPILMTFRTSKEGGEKSIEPEDYAKLNIKAAQTGYVDFIDVEIFTGDAIVTKIIDGAHAAGVKVIASNHDFHKTPEKSDIIYRLRKMQDMNADIPKIAVMPQNKKDVLTLLSATEEMTSLYADRPIITMSMAGTGVISRLCGEVFGSSMTFGAAKKASAPGQMGVKELETILGLLHSAM